MARVLIVHASRHGGTAGIADRIGDVLRSEGNEVVVADAARRPDPAGFDAYVVGSGVYMGSWLKEGTEFHIGTGDARDQAGLAVQQRAASRLVQGDGHSGYSARACARTHPRNW